MLAARYRAQSDTPLTGSAAGKHDGHPGLKPGLNRRPGCVGDPYAARGFRQDVVVHGDILPCRRAGRQFRGQRDRGSSAIEPVRHRATQSATRAGDWRVPSLPRNRLAKGPSGTRRPSGVRPAAAPYGGRCHQAGVVQHIHSNRDLAGGGPSCGKTVKTGIAPMP